MKSSHIYPVRDDNSLKDKIYNSIEEELLRAIKARYLRNNGHLTGKDALIEASFCLAVNNLTLLNNFREKNAVPGSYIADEDMKYFFSGADKAMGKMFKKDYNQSHFSTIMDKYYQIVSNPDAKRLINYHYNELYGYEGGNAV